VPNFSVSHGWDVGRLVVDGVNCREGGLPLRYLPVIHAGTGERVPGGTTSRKLEVFVLHAVNDNRAVNYAELFAFIANIPARERSIERGEKLVAIPELTVSSSRASFVAYEGPLGTNPLIFDSSEARARIERLSSGEVLATKTHGIIDLGQREAVIEFNHRGAKAHEVASVFEELGRRNPNWDTLALELNPLPTAEFLTEIQKFRRVRLASIRVARPNPAWNRSYEMLKDVAQESSGQTIDLAVSAGRGQSLSTRGGIIRCGLRPENRHENELESVTERRRTHAGESVQRGADHRAIARA
jgi:hypothetical protein